jgi:hypothetical protein
MHRINNINKKNAYFYKYFKQTHKNLKMKKQFLVLSISLLFLLNLNAQTAKTTITWGSEFMSPKKHVFTGVLGNPKDGYVSINQRYGKSLTLQKFNTDLKLKSENAVDLKTMPKGYMSEFFLDMNNKYYWVYSTWDKKAKIEQLNVRPIDISTAKLTGKSTPVIKSDKKLAGDLVATGFYKIGTANKWESELSDNGSKVLVHYRLKPEIKDDSKNKDVIGLYVFDSEFEEISGRRVEMPYVEEFLDIMSYQIDNAGNAYILGKVYEGSKKEKTKDKKPNYHFEIFKYTKDNSEAIKISLKLESTFVSSIKLVEGKEGNMILVGYYSKSTYGAADGVFCFNLNSTTNKIENKFKGFYEFPSDIMKAYEKSRTAKKVNDKEAKDANELTSLKIKDIMVNEDGSFDVFGEEYTHIWYVRINNRRVEYVHRLIYGDIYVMRIGADGEMKQVNKIPKYQFKSLTTSSPVLANEVFGMSFYLDKKDGNYFIYYVDNLKNLNIKATDAPERHVDGAGGVLMSTKLGSDGSLTKNKLFDFREKKYYINVTEMDRIGPNDYVALAYSYSDNPFAYLTFNSKPKKFVQISVK